MVEYNRALGKMICDKYLQDKLILHQHSYHCGELCYELASKIIARNPEFRNELDPELAGFLGYTHNIGSIITREKHELHTKYLLTKKEGIPDSIAEKTRHGQLVEDYDDLNYHPVGLDGILLTYVDIIVRPESPTNEIIPMKERIQEMAQFMEQRISVFTDYTDKMIECFEKATSRYLRYEALIHALLK